LRLLRRRLRPHLVLEEFEQRKGHGGAADDLHEIAPPQVTVDRELHGAPPSDIRYRNESLLAMMATSSFRSPDSTNFFFNPSSKQESDWDRGRETANWKYCWAKHPFTSSLAPIFEMSSSPLAKGPSRSPPLMIVPELSTALPLSSVRWRPT